MKNPLILLYIISLTFILAFPVEALDYDYQFKIALIGGSGRSSLVDRFVKKKFNEYSPTTVAYDLATKIIIIGDIRYKLGIWYSSSDKKFKKFQLDTLADAHAVLIITDLTEPQSTEELLEWVKQARTRARENCPILLVGTKSDLVDDRILSEESIELFCWENNLPYFETSARKGLNVTHVFSVAAETIRNQISK